MGGQSRAWGRGKGRQAVGLWAGGSWGAVGELGVGWGGVSAVQVLSTGAAALTQLSGFEGAVFLLRAFRLSLSLQMVPVSAMR